MAAGTRFRDIGFCFKSLSRFAQYPPGYEKELPQRDGRWTLAMVFIMTLHCGIRAGWCYENMPRTQKHATFWLYYYARLCDHDITYLRRQRRKKEFSWDDLSHPPSAVVIHCWTGEERLWWTWYFFLIIPEMSLWSERLKQTLIVHLWLSIPSFCTPQSPNFL